MITRQPSVNSKTWPHFPFMIVDWAGLGYTWISLILKLHYIIITIVIKVWQMKDNYRLLTPLSLRNGTYVSSPWFWAGCSVLISRILWKWQFPGLALRDWQLPFLTLGTLVGALDCHMTWQTIQRLSSNKDASHMKKPHAERGGPRERDTSQPQLLEPPRHSAHCRWGPRHSGAEMCCPLLCPVQMK